MYYILFSKTEERIYQDMEQVAKSLIEGWKLYGYTDSENLAYSLLHECRNY